jgi:hypothetical protein
MMYGAKVGIGVLMPSSALNTEMAGVMAPSPYSNAAPRIPMATTPARPCAMPSSDINARIPPSPSLSARMTIATYLTDVVMISVQTISDSMPRAAAGVASPSDHSSTVLKV